MSAFVVSNNTINAVCHMLDLDAACCHKGTLGQQVMTESGPRDNGDLWGSEMQSLNLAAVGHRYAHRETPPYAPPFRWSPSQYSLMTMLKAADCWCYQCQEGDQFTNTDIYKRVDNFRDAVRQSIVSRLPEYDAIAWDLEENDYCIAK